MKVMHSEGIRLVCGWLPPTTAQAAGLRVLKSSNGAGLRHWRRTPADCPAVGVAGSTVLAMVGVVALAVVAVRLWMCVGVVDWSIVTVGTPPFCPSA